MKIKFQYLYKILSKIILCYSFFNCFLIYAQDLYKIEQFTSNDGLSHDCVHGVFQDSQGYIWIATEGGLNKYDGYNISEYVHNSNDSFSIGKTKIFTIYEDPLDKGESLWIGTDDGLSLFNKETEQFFPINTQPVDSIDFRPGDITKIYKDKNNSYWIGGWTGIKKYRKENGTIKSYLTEIKRPGVNVFFQDYLNNLWIGTDNGLFQCKAENILRGNETFNLYGLDETNNSLEIYTIFEDKNRVLWIGSNDGLYYFDRIQQKIERPQFRYGNFKNAVIVLLYEDSDEYLNAITNIGLVRINPKRDSLHIHVQDFGDIYDANIRSVYMDKSGIIWLGTTCNGIYKITPKRNNFKLYRNDPEDEYSLNDNWVISFGEDGFGNMYIGTVNGSLNLFDTSSKKFIQIGLAPTITRMDKDKEGILWYTNWHALIKYNRKINVTSGHFLSGRKSSFDIKIYNDAVKNKIYRDSCLNYIINNFSNELRENKKIDYVEIDKNGNIWCLIDNSLHKFYEEERDFIRFEVNTPESISDEIRMIYIDSRNELWLGTDHKGLVRGIPNSTGQYKFIHYIMDEKNIGSLSNNTINTICEEKNGSLWFGTNSGLNKLDPNKEYFIHLGIKEGLVSEVISGILCDDENNLWISTNKGISKFDQTNKHFFNYDINDGLQSNTFAVRSCFKSKTGELYFGGSNGFNVFHPDDIKINTSTPNVVINQISLFNEPLEIDENSPLTVSPELLNEIIFEHDQDVFSFDFAALDFTEPQKNKYAYMMVGVDPDWVYTDATRRFATYTKLDPGRYLFKVKGSNNDGIWNKTGTSLRVIILPPWWGTYWAYSIYVILLISIIYSIWSFQLNRIHLKHNLELEHMQAEKYREMDQIKSRFFANISHEFRTPLTLIIGIIKKITDRIDDGKLKDELTTVSDYSKKLKSLVNQLLDLSKLEAGKMKLETNQENIIPLLKGMVLSFISLSETKKITLNFNSSTEMLFVYIDKKKMEKIINNLLINAFKFTPEGGTIEVNVHKKETYTEIVISDTGIGIPKERLSKIFDRFYQGDSSQTREFEGTGIGLSLTKELVELHKGQISVSSEEGKGTSIFVSLPLGKDHLKSEEIINNEFIKEDPFEPISEKDLKLDENIQDKGRDLNLLIETEKPILLIVEDNRDVRNYIKEYFENEYKLLEAENGMEGLEKSLEYIPDIIISDVMMPKMDGFKFLEKLKSDVKTSHIPIILLTAKATDSDKIEGLKIGADDYMMKPFDAEELQIRVKNLIEQRKRLREHFQQDSVFNFSDKDITSIDREFLKKATKIIETHIADNEFGVDIFAKELFMSRQQLRRKLISIIGESPSDLTRKIRLGKSAKLIEQNFGNISEIALEVGFSSPANFTKSFRKQFGLSPSEYEQKFKNNR